ncbi:hypothetical protein U1Q18_002299 [Sarracenia purpurea var. burkii]
MGSRNNQNCPRNAAICGKFPKWVGSRATQQLFVLVFEFIDLRPSVRRRRERSGQGGSGGLDTWSKRTRVEETERVEECTQVGAFPGRAQGSSSGQEQEGERRPIGGSASAPRPTVVAESGVNMLPVVPPVGGEGSIFSAGSTGSEAFERALTT